MYPGFMDGYTEIAAVESGMVELVREHFRARGCEGNKL